MLSAASVSSSSSSSSSGFSAFPVRFRCHCRSSRSSVHFRPLTVKSAARTAERARSSSSSLYQVLGIRNGATGREIKAAYRRLARVLHPDAGSNTQPSPAGDFIKLHDAYQTLSDPEKRAAYDRSLFWTRAALGSVNSDVPVTAASFGRFSRRTWETDQCW